ncbi:MAG: hypothetical protein GY767_14510 [Shimia sp.]|nr:hypothetical protein [Shimia sp.]
MAEHDITVQKLRKLAGIVSSSEKYKDLVPGAEADHTPRKPKPPVKKKPKAKTEPVVHQRCTHNLEGLEKGQLCPECERGKLYNGSSRYLTAVLH